MIRSAAAIVALMVCGVTTAATINVPGDYATIQQAISASFDGDEILVAPGTYNENLDFNSRGITLRSSGGPSVTSIVGQTTDYVMRVESLAGPGAIEGFDIGSTKATGAMVFCDDSTLSVVNCTILEELEGLYVSGGSTLEIRDSQISCTAGECIYVHKSVLTLSDSSLTSAGELVLHNWDSQATISGCSFENSTCASVLSFFTGTIPSGLILSDSVFRGNTTTAGMLITRNPFSISGCTFESNVSNGDSILNIEGSVGDSLMSGCTFAGNSSANAAVEISSDPIQISDTTFCENTPVDIVGPWVNGGGNEFPDDCDDVEGACCVDDVCYEVELLFCESAGGEWLGFNVVCEADTCADPPQFGACCVNGEAVSLYDYDCDRILGLFMGEGTNPDDVTCPPHCQGDANGDGEVDTNDILLVISNWGPCP